jgi:hypothetical protein
LTAGAGTDAAGTTLTRNHVRMAWRAATHEIHVDAGRGVVIKRFRSWDRGEPAREWTVKVREYRRLAALFWLVMLLPGSPAHHRNPPGTLERQAARLLLLLDCGG